jgi:simple sugar transport system permease protein
MLRKYTNTVILSSLIIIIIVLLSIFVPERFLSLRSFQSMAYQIPELMLLTLAMFVSIISGGINLSTVNTAGLSGVVAGIVMVNVIKHETSMLNIIFWISISIVAAIITSVLCGLFNGYLIGFVEVAPILVTLGTLTLYKGIALKIAGGETVGVSGFPKQFLWIGNGKIFEIPVPFIILILVILIIYFVLQSKWGLSLYMTGSSSIVVKFSGINTSMVLLKTYVLSGLLCGVASIIMISRYNSARADYGISYLLVSILAVLLAGANIAGGHGPIRDVVLSVVLLQIISTGFNVSGVDIHRSAVDLIWGALIILMLFINFIENKRRSRLILKKINL